MNLLNKDQAFNAIEKATSLEVITVYSSCAEILCTKWLDHLEEVNIQKAAAISFVSVVQDQFLFTVE